MTREEFVSAHPLVAEFERRGVKLSGGSGGNLNGKCPVHQEKKGESLSVDPVREVWNCHGGRGCGGGSVIDLIMKLDGKTPAEVLANGEAPRRMYAVETRKSPSVSEAPKEKPVIVWKYTYFDHNGQQAFLVVRFRFLDGSKTFQQWRSESQRNMDGVERVIYRLPEVRAANQVWIVEGEKDADTLVGMGYCATTNCGGAGKWLDSYSLDLAGKELVTCGDNDLNGKTTGADHIEAVFKSVSPGAKNVRKVKVPLPHKDITEFAEGFSDPEEAKRAVTSLLLAAPVFVKGHDLPLFTLADLEAGYIDYAENTATRSLDLSLWLPCLKDVVRPLVPGELVTLLADTGTGKTALMQNMAVQVAGNLPSIFFELELPPELMFERFTAISEKQPAKFIEEGYRRGNRIGRDAMEKVCPKMLVCTQARLTTQRLEEMINRSELRLGERPLVVIVDYLGLMRGEGRSRYEQFSNIVEELRIIAKTTRTVIVATSQVARDKKRSTPELTLHDAKESGSIENSSSLVLGAWRDPDDATCLKLKVLKNTKGTTGYEVECDFDGPTMRITERSGGYPSQKKESREELVKISGEDAMW